MQSMCVCMDKAVTQRWSPLKRVVYRPMSWLQTLPTYQNRNIQVFVYLFVDMYIYFSFVFMLISVYIGCIFVFVFRGTHKPRYTQRKYAKIYEQPNNEKDIDARDTQIISINRNREENTNDLQCFLGRGRTVVRGIRIIPIVDYCPTTAASIYNHTTTFALNWMPSMRMSSLTWICYICM